MRRPSPVRLRAEPLEDRTVPASVVVSNNSDLVNDPVTSIAALNAVTTGDGISLREAITAANNTAGDDTITFAAGVTSPIVLGGTQLPAITGTLTISGPGANLLAVSGNDLSRVFAIASGAVVEIAGLTVTHGSTTGDGGGVTSDGTLTIRNAVVTSNTARQSGLGGGVHSRGPLTVIGSTISDNAVRSSGGNPAGSGGGVFAWNDVTITDSTLSGNAARQGGGVFLTAAAGTHTLSLTRVTLTGNSAGSAGATGGGIYYSGIMGLTDSTLADNTAESSAGAIFCATGPLDIRDSTFRHNTAGTSGGAILILSGNPSAATIVRSRFEGNVADFGGGVNNGDTLTVGDCVFTGNTATSSGGGIYNSGSLTVTDTTLADNAAPNGSGGGISTGSFGGAQLVVTGSTFARNTAQSGGGLSTSSLTTTTVTNTTFATNSAVGTNASGGGINNQGSLTLLDCTIAGNSVGVGFGGGGLRTISIGSVTLTNTVIAGNTTGTTSPDVSGAVTRSSSNNLIGIGTGMTGIAHGTDGNQIGIAAAPINPLLGPLADNGGPTQTIALLAGSPAIDTGVPAGTPGLPATDQRGPGFARVVGPAADIGAFELQTVVVVVVSPATLPAGQVGAGYSQTLTAAGSAGPFTFTVSAGALPDGVTLSTAGVLSGTPTTAGTASFTVTAADAAGPTGFRAYQLLVDPAPNTPPTITDVPNQTIPQNGATAALGFAVGDAQTPAANLGVAGTSSNPSLVPNANVVIGVGAGGARTVTVTPVAGASGTATITLTVTDADGASVTDTFDVTVTPNSPPTITDVVNQTIPQNGSTAALGFAVGDAQTPAANLGVAGTSSNPSLVPNANVVIGVGAGGARTVTVTPATGATGTATITLTVTDADGASVTDTFDVTVTAPPPNTPPTITDIGNRTVPVNGTTGALGFTVADAQTPAASLTVTGASSDQSLVPNANVVIGVGAGGARTVTVTPATGATGTATITLTVTDGALTATDTFDVTVTAPPPNTPPTITDVPNQSIPQNGSTAALGFTVGDAQTPSASLSVAGSSSNTALVPNANVSITVGAGGARTVTVTPATGATGTATITLTVTDGALTATDTFDVTVSPPLPPPPNTPPTITPVADQTVPVNRSVGPLLVTITDAETPGGLSATIRSSNQALIPDGSLLGGPGSGTGPLRLTITPTPGATGTATITITATDAGGLTAVESFDVTVTAPPGPPPVAVRSLVASGTGGSARVYDPDAAGRFGSADDTVNPFNRSTGSVRTAQADVNGDGTPDVVLVTGPGTALRLAVVSGTDRRTVLVAPFDPFGGNFTGGGFAAAADLDGDGRAEFLVTADQGGGPRVTIFSFTAAGAAATQRLNFLGIDDDNFRGGARAALGDVDGDGTPDLAVGAGFLGGPRVALFDGTTLLGGAPARLINDFFAFPGTDATTLRNGVFVAAGDVDGDGRSELIFGGGPGGAPRVFILSGAVLAAGNVSGAQAAPVSNFFVANNSSDRGGVRVATADADGDGRADVYAGSGERSAARVRVYLGKNFAPGGGEPGAFQDVEVLGGGVLTNGVFVG